MVMADQFTVDWLNQLLKGMKPLWAGSQLKMADQANLPKLFRAEVTFFETNCSQQEILRVLERQNPRLQCTSWRIVGRNANKNSKGVYYSFEMAEKEWEALKADHFRVYFGLSRYTLRVKEGKAAEKSK